MNCKAPTRSDSRSVCQRRLWRRR